MQSFSYNRLVFTYTLFVGYYLLSIKVQAKKEISHVIIYLYISSVINKVCDKRQRYEAYQSVTEFRR